MILTVFSDVGFEMEPRISSTLLKFGIALLEGGNKKVQATIFHFFTTFPRSSTIFEKLYRSVNEQVEMIRIKGRN